VRDAVIAGHNEDYVSALIFPNLERLHELNLSLPAEATVESLLSDIQVIQFFQELINQFGAAERKSSRRIMSASIENEPPKLETGELSDKNAISQRTILHRRSATVSALYSTDLQQANGHTANNNIIIRVSLE